MVYPHVNSLLPGRYSGLQTYQNTASVRYNYVRVSISGAIPWTQSFCNVRRPRHDSETERTYVPAVRK